VSLAPLPELLEHARRNHYAVGYFESWDIYSLEAVVDAAEAERSPVIIGIGGLTSNHRWLRERGIALYGAAANALARRATVPTAVLFNEGDSFEETVSSLCAGYNAVMMVTQSLPWDRAVADTAALTAAAHALGVAVEGEVDGLPEMREGVLHSEGSELTDVEQAVEFVRQTGVDCLAVAAGSVHFVTGAYTPTIEVDLIREVAAAVDVQLVLHGGSGVPPDQIQAAIAAGIAKVNVGTRLKHVFGRGLQEALARDGGDPNLAYGSRLPGDVMACGASALTDEVRRYIQIFGSAGKAGRR